jgi:hypothetical protein
MRFEKSCQKLTLIQIIGIKNEKNNFTTQSYHYFN